MNNNNSTELENSNFDLVVESPSKLVKVREEVLRDFPLLSLRERDLEIHAPFSFSTLYYNRPVGNSRMASAEVELFSPTGDVITEKIYFEYKFTEAERLEDAKKVESF